jgi:putative DNA primase/helicase
VNLDEEKRKLIQEAQAARLSDENPVETAPAQFLHAAAASALGVPAPFDDNPMPKPAAKSNGKRIAERMAAKLELQQRAITNKDGTLRACLANALDLLRNHTEWSGVLAWDAFSHRTVTKQKTPFGKSAGEPWDDIADGLTLEWMQRHDVLLQSSRQVGEAVQIVARENAFHPVRDYVNSLVWDKTERLPFWLRDYFGAGDTPFVRAVSSRWLVSAIARVFQPGVKVDHTLLLEGSQGVGKSSGLNALFGDAWFLESISVLGSKDSKLEIRGKWCAEISELSAMKRAEIETVKNFLSLKTDTLRDPYGRLAADVPRQNVFSATTNSSCYLQDETGNRRFWPVRCTGRARVKELAAARDSLFAEAYDKYKTGTPWWIDTAELLALARTEQDARYAPGQWDELIEPFLDNPQPRTISRAPFFSTPGRVLAAEILEHCIRKEQGHWTQADINSVVKCLVHLGYERKRVTIGNRRLWFYVPKQGE